jgi:SAM-dependent methyltransferase
MSLTHSDIRELYTKRIDLYSSFTKLFQSSQGIRTLLSRSNLLRPGLRVLDAGCGFGRLTFAFLDALKQKNFDYQGIDAFDLTPAMLDRFRESLEACGNPRINLQQADVLALGTLPPSWMNYDLILSGSMLEYVPKQELVRALAGLQRRMAPGGRIFVLITRKTPETKVLIEWWWRAESYTGNELLGAFESAGFSEPVFHHFPLRYAWLNRAMYAIEASFSNPNPSQITGKT